MHGKQEESPIFRICKPSISILSLDKEKIMDFINAKCSCTIKKCHCSHLLSKEHYTTMLVDAFGLASGSVKSDVRYGKSYIFVP